MTYMAKAAVHPANLCIVVASILLLASHWGLVALAAALGVEAVYLMVLPTRGFFRASVREGLEQDEQRARLRARETLVLQMADGHREELARLEALLDASLAAGRLRHGGPALGAWDATGMARLTLSYIRLAVDHRACAQALTMTDPAALHAKIGALDVAWRTQPSHARPRLRRWLEIAKLRAERWREANATMESLGHQLATIAELTHLVHQDALSVSSSALSADVDGILDEYEHRGRAAREVVGMAMVDTEAS